MPSIPDTAKAWLDGQAYVVVASLNADGSPHTAVHWVTRDGDDILLSTVRGRKHADNIERDPRLSVMCVSPDDPYSYLEVRGTATVTDEGGRELIDDLCEKYRGERPYPWDKPDAVRIVVRVPPDHVVFHGS
jgi:PPOX class probable F420-dependent enzyme